MARSNYIALQASCEADMDLSACSGCTACSLRCAKGVPATREEWTAIHDYISKMTDNERENLQRVLSQNKAADLGDEVSVEMCRYWDVTNERCAVYSARPLICRLLGHVEWLPCPIEKVTQIVPTEKALALMSAYAKEERRTFEEWESLPRSANVGEQEAH